MSGEQREPILQHDQYQQDMHDYQYQFGNTGSDHHQQQYNRHPSFAEANFNLHPHTQNSERMVNSTRQTMSHPISQRGPDGTTQYVDPTSEGYM
jgi:hypothetical protein